MVSERGLQVLRAIVQDYVDTREPVGSKAIVERHAFGVSAATIRNDMALLEDEELIAAPHTSSGRVPTGGEIRVLDAQNVLLMTLDIGDEGKTQFALPEGAANTGLMIEVEVSEGHSDYWMLTPDDIAYGQGKN